jgi:diadenylate cyclase
MKELLDLLAWFWSALLPLLQMIVEVGLLASIIYLALVFLKGTRAAPILLGIVITTLVGWLLSQLLGLQVIEWLLARVPALIALAVLIIFQPELRRAFAEIGSNPHRLLREHHDVSKTIDHLINAAFYLAERNIGALIAIERDIGMRAITDSGVRVDAPVSAELLITIFYPNTPLHDGAVVLRGGVIVAASCFFPLTQAPLSRNLGTRHRAGVGITEETDAVVIIVSEERGTVSLATRGILVQDISKDRIRRHLTNYLVKQHPAPQPAAQTTVS